MLARIIEASLRNRFAVLLVATLAVLAGIQSALELSLDAFPDTTPIQVQVNTFVPALGPEEVERQVTFPVEQAVGSAKGLVGLRSVSKYGLSLVVAVFEDGTDVYFARQQIAERLWEVQLPEGVERPSLGPVSTGLGEIYHYLVRGEGMEPTELRALHDWVIRPRLLRVPGVAEVNPWGGWSGQFEVRIDPVRLAKHRLTLERVARALRENNVNAGGGPVSRAGESVLIQASGRLRDASQIGRVVVDTVGNVPIRIADLGTVEFGRAQRRGAVTADGRGEALLGLAFLRMGENSRDVTLALDAAVEDLRGMLPPGVSIDVVYRRTDLIRHVLETAGRNLFEGAVLVVAVLFAFLGSIRSGLIVASAIPLSMLFAATAMQKAGIAGSLMSLGAIDFGLIVDSSVVMVENATRRLAEDRTGRGKLAVVRDAALEVRGPTLFGELIIMVVYLPILMLEGVEGKLFRPMALTVIFALAGSMLVSLTVMPALASLALPRRPREKPTLADRAMQRAFSPLLGAALRFPRTTLAVVGVITLAATLLGLRLGAEFVPRLEEGAIVINTIRLAGVGLDDSAHYGTHIERILQGEFPDEIDRIWSRTGSAEVATDPMGFELTDVFITLKPRERWARARTQEGLVAAMAEVTKDLPGMRAVYSQPIEMRVNEMTAGVRSAVGVKVSGADMGALKGLADRVGAALRGVPGAADVAIEPIAGQAVRSIEVDREELARHGVSAREVLDLIKAIPGLAVGEVLEPDRRFPLVIRLPSDYWDDPRSLERILVTTADGQRLPLTRLVKIEESEKPSTITREWGRRRVLVQCNVRGRDLASFVEEAREAVGREVPLPEGYALEWGGQYEHMIRAQGRLMIAVPLALGLVLSLLYLSFRSARDALMVASGVLFARAGGIVGLWAMGLPLTVSAGVGFVALAGVSILEGLILVHAIRDRMARGMPKREAIERARKERLRPVLMTGLVAALGFVPMMLSEGIGAEVQRPLATVVVFGILGDTFLTLLALPAMYSLWGRGAPRGGELEGEPTSTGGGALAA